MKVENCDSLHSKDTDHFVYCRQKLRSEIPALAEDKKLQMKATVLEATGLIGTKDLDELLGMVVCDIKSKKCAYGECEFCKNKCVNFTIRDKKVNDSISWYEWVLKPHEYKPKRNSDVTKTMKKIVL
ncbi:unnamed protein product [Euphydryas editha]|uniref:Uncharacterized protein n=1 Tax=Euphydryas editha TaxID=104508 RepID=A0AAU9UC77_EUPED|nr:unnamed protein product [Euphydryas editha]